MTALQTVLAPFTMKGFYLLTWGTALGTNVWNTMVRLQDPSPIAARPVAQRLTPSVGLQVLQDASAQHIRDPPVPPHPALLLILDLDGLGAAAHAPVLPPGAHLLVVPLRPAELAIIRGRPTRSPHSRRALAPGC
jgi:hypothetical protein